MQKTNWFSIILDDVFIIYEICDDILGYSFGSPLPLKLGYTHTHRHSGRLLSHKKMKYCHFSSMDGPREYHTKLNKSEKDKYYMIPLTCGI